MKNFTTFLSERVQIRARKNMPQIDNMDEFVKDLKKEGYKINSEKIEAKKLKPTQSDFNMDKVKGMIASGNYKNKSIVVTSDNYILDGHHRWKSHMEVGEDQPIIRVNMTFEKLFDFVDGKKYVKYKQIHEAHLNDWYNTNMSMSDYMTDEEKEKFNKEKSNKIYDDYFTQEAFDKIYKTVKEDGEGSAVTTNAPNSVAGVSMPPTAMNTSIKRRKNTDHEYRD